MTVESNSSYARWLPHRELLIARLVGMGRDGRIYIPNASDLQGPPETQPLGEGNAHQKVLAKRDKTCRFDTDV